VEGFDPLELIRLPFIIPGAQDDVEVHLGSAVEQVGVDLLFWRVQIVPVSFGRGSRSRVAKRQPSSGVLAGRPVVGSERLAAATAGTDERHHCPGCPQNLLEWPQFRVPTPAINDSPQLVCRRTTVKGGSDPGLPSGLSSEDTRQGRARYVTANQTAFHGG